MTAEPTVQLFDSARFDALSAAARNNPRLRQNHNLHDSPQASVQRFFNAVEPGSYVIPHCHRQAGKEETLLMLRGKLGLILFDASGGIRETHLLSPGGPCSGCHLELHVWHSVVALETGTIFFETKTGPYIPLAPEEQAPWAPAPDTPEAHAWLQQMRALFPG